MEEIRLIYGWVFAITIISIQRLVEKRSRPAKAQKDFKKRAKS